MIVGSFVRMKRLMGELSTLDLRLIVIVASLRLLPGDEHLFEQRVEPHAALRRFDTEPPGKVASEP